jgi:hypothetical protein
MKTLKERYLSTFTGLKFRPYDPHPDQIDIRDIAHGLSLTCRFSGQTPFMYSVCEHSLHVASRLPDKFKLEGLLHDSSEAYLSDIVKPVKHGLPDYRVLAVVVEQAIALKFDLEFPWPSQVKTVDLALLRHELFSFFGADRYFEDFGEVYVAKEPTFVRALPPEVAERQFLDLYSRLTMARHGQILNAAGAV